MTGYKLTETQRNLLIGQQFAPDQYFNPVPDINGDYFIFDGEVNGCTNEDYMWVKDLLSSEYIQPIQPTP